MSHHPTELAFMVMSEFIITDSLSQ